MIRSSVRSAGLALLLMVNGCGDLVPLGSDTKQPGLNVAEAALQGGAGQIALQVSDGVLRDSPNNVRAMEIKGDALALLGAYDQAAAIYQTLLTKDPNSVRATIGLGRISLSKQPAVAEALFQQVLKRDPRDVTALNNVGIARDLQGHHAMAQTAYRQALAINPELDSAQANLALSMAMTGQGPAAVELLKAKATRPGVSPKVRHDYAVVLAMAGNRGEAERILGEDMSPADARQVLDGVTDPRGRAAREGSPEPGRSAVVSRDWDEPPPDVVQLPDQPARAAPPSRTADIVAPAFPVTATRAPAALTAAMAATMAAPPPTVVRPQPVAGLDSDAPALVQPVTPVAAAITNQHSLALPIQGMGAPPTQGMGFGARGLKVTAAVEQAGAAVEQAGAAVAQVVPTASEQAFTAAPERPVAAPERPVAAAPEPAAIVPSVVAMPPTQTSRRAAAVSEATPEPPAEAMRTARIALPDAPPPPPVLPPVPLPPTYQALKSTAQVGPATRQVAAIQTGSRPDASRQDNAPAEGVKYKAAATPRPNAPSAAAPAATVIATANVVADTAASVIPVGRSAKSDDSSTMVQFAATASEESARALWQVLLHRFPDVLGSRDPVVLRFEHEGNVFWRVRTEGFANLTEAQTLCARMRAGGQSCYVPRS